MDRHIHRRRRRSLGTIVAILLVLTGIGPAPTAQAAPYVPVRIQNMDNTTVNTLACQDVLFIAVRGSSETTSQDGGKGVPVNYAWGDFLARMGTLSQADNVTTRVGLWAVNYPAASVGVAVTDPGAYFGSIKDGADTLVNALQKRERRCGTGQFHEKVVLVGYSQGAMVIHRALLAINNDKTQALAGNDATRQAIAGSLLIADGDRSPSDGATLSGTAWGPLPVAGIGQDAAYGNDPVNWRLHPGEQASGYGLNDISTPSPSVATPTAPSWSVCRALDPVCDFGNFAPTVILSGGENGISGIATAVLTTAEGISAHMTAYQNNQDVGRDVTAAAQNLANTVYAKVNPPLQLTSLPPAAQRNRDYSFQLTIRGLPTDRTLSWSASNLPPGLTLDRATGWITGRRTDDVTGPTILTVRESPTGRTRSFTAQLVPNHQPIQLFRCDQFDPDTGAAIGNGPLYVWVSLTATASPVTTASGTPTTTMTVTGTVEPLSDATSLSRSFPRYDISFDLRDDTTTIRQDAELRWKSAGPSTGSAYIAGSTTVELPGVVLPFQAEVRASGLSFHSTVPGTLMECVPYGGYDGWVGQRSIS